MLDKNLALMTDSYKAGHAPLYKPGTGYVHSYFESRGGLFPRNLFFGMQYYLKEFLVGSVVTKQHVEEATEFWTGHFGRSDYFNPDLWMYIVDERDGCLPLSIKSAPEGTVVPTSNVLFTIENTDPNCYWLVNWLETLLSKLWYTTSVASSSYYIKRDILSQLEISGDVSGIDFKCHDFAYRGVTSEEQAALGAAAHLLSFKGTDTVAGIRLLQKYYDAPMCGFSIPATEHSIMCSFGKDNEHDAIRNLLTQHPSGMIACVSDTYDIFHCCRELWGKEFRDEVINRDGCVVIRPDSGDPKQVVIKCLNILWDKFGGTKNDKGYFVLDPHVRMIQGDGMNRNTIIDLYKFIVANGYSADNLAVGSGGGLLQDVNRDTCKFAIKASAVGDRYGEINHNVAKSPITDIGKRSKEGQLKLVYDQTERRYKTVSSMNQSEYFYATNTLVETFRDGELTHECTYDDILEQIDLSVHITS